MFTKYLSNGSREFVFRAMTLRKGSAIWNFMGKCRSVLLPYLSWVMHNGSKVGIWDDAWNGYCPMDSIRDSSPLKSILLDKWRVFLSDYFNIVQYGNLVVAKWKSIEFLPISPSLKAEFSSTLKDRIIILSKKDDELIWTKNSSKKYSVKDGYNSLMSVTILSSWPYKLFWHLACLPKVKAFAWLVVQDRVLTGMRLDRMGLSIVFPCVSCK